jgi:hypothetical protein
MVTSYAKTRDGGRWRVLAGLIAILVRALASIRGLSGTGGDWN